MSTPTRDDFADILNRIARLLDLKGENPFKIRAYRTGADVVETYEGDIVQRAIDNDLKGIKGIGDALAKKLHELATTGKMEFWEKLRAEFPESIHDLFEVEGLGPKKIKALYDELDVDSVEKLKEVCETGKVSALSGFGAKSVEKILKAIEYRESHVGRFRLGDAAPWAERILEELKSHPDTLRAEVAGSIRRSKETVHDLDFIVATKNPAEVNTFFAEMEAVEDVSVRGETKTSVRLKNGLQCDLRTVSNAEYPFALAYFTGSKEHNVVIRSRALKRGFSLNEYGFTPTGDKKPPKVNDEADLYKALDLAYVEPELRENRGEIEAAEEGTLPDLVEIMNLRGTFHNHTTASDGHASLEQMAEAAQELGLQYLGIADHSKSSFQANGLDEKRLEQQISEIQKLNDSYGDDFRLFAGSEVDILRDGSLDFDDVLMGELDYVVASVHNALQIPEKDMTERVLRAIDNPHVTMLGHLTGRLLLAREASAIDIPRIIEACADNGCIIELNANPSRLDMDWRWWKSAREKGVKCAINPDAHRTETLDHLYFGVRLARKGWLTRDDVVNCLPLGKIEPVLSARLNS